MPILNDGTVLSSMFSVSSGAGPSGYTMGVSEPFLRVGRVSKVYLPDEEGNQSKRFIEYDVELDYSTNSADYTKIVFPRARMGSMFGAIADYFNWTPRVVNTEPTEITQGSLVLVACINGDTRQAIILGGLQHPSLPKDDPEKGHHLAFEFNGVKIDINKDGEFTILFRGATDHEGGLTENADSSAEGSQVVFKKDGTIFIKTNDKKVNIESAGVNLGGVNVTDSIVKGTTYRQAEQNLHSQLQAQLNALQTALMAASTSMTTAAAALKTGTPIPAAEPMAAAAASIGTAAGTAATMASAIASFESNANSYLSDKNKTD